MSDLERLGQIFAKVVKDTGVYVDTYEEYIDGYPKLTHEEWLLIRSVRYGTVQV